MSNMFMNGYDASLPSVGLRVSCASEEAFGNTEELSAYVVDHSPDCYIHLGHYEDQIAVVVFLH